MVAHAGPLSVSVKLCESNEMSEWTPPGSAVQAESGPQHGEVILGIAPQKEVTLQKNDGLHI